MVVVPGGGASVGSVVAVGGGIFARRGPPRSHLVCQPRSTRTTSLRVGARIRVGVQGFSVTSRTARSDARTECGSGTRRSGMWKVGQVMSVELERYADAGYGFNVTTDRGKPLVLFA